MDQFREEQNQDFDQICIFLQPIVDKGKTYPYPRNNSKEEAYRLLLKKGA